MSSGGRSILVVQPLFLDLYLVVRSFISCQSMMVLVPLSFPIVKLGFLSLSGRARVLSFGHASTVTASFGAFLHFTTYRARGGNVISRVSICLRAYPESCTRAGAVVSHYKFRCLGYRAGIHLLRHIIAVILTQNPDVELPHLMVDLIRTTETVTCQVQTSVDPGALHLLRTFFLLIF